jgi:hypothetical protein
MTTARMTAETFAGNSSATEDRRSKSDLDRRYGRVAISAVAAAMRYGSESATRASEATDKGSDRTA